MRRKRKEMFAGDEDEDGMSDEDELGGVGVDVDVDVDAGVDVDGGWVVENEMILRQEKRIGYGRSYLGRRDGSVGGWHAPRVKGKTFLGDLKESGVCCVAVSWIGLRWVSDDLERGHEEM